MKTIYAIASNANPLIAHSTFECPHCGRAHDGPVPLNGCFSNDCPGHDEPVSSLEALQWEAEDNLHRMRGRYVRPIRTPKQPVTRR
jgi:hypothetical protein